MIISSFRGKATDIWASNNSCWYIVRAMVIDHTGIREIIEQYFLHWGDSTFKHALTVISLLFVESTICWVSFGVRICANRQFEKLCIDINISFYVDGHTTRRPCSLVWTFWSVSIICLAYPWCSVFYAKNFWLRTSCKSSSGYVKTVVGIHFDRLFSIYNESTDGFTYK